MTTDDLRVPRMTDVAVRALAMSETYPEDDANLDTVLLTAIKFGGRQVVPYEQLDDSNIGIITELQKSWARTYSKVIDNAVFGTTAAANGTLTVPFNSVYRTVSQEAAANKVASAGPITFANLSAVLGKAENGGYFSEPDTIVVAHNSLKEDLRNIVDLNGRPLFIDAIPNTQPATLFGYQIQFSDGAKTSATNTDKPTGNPLLVVGNRQHLILGDREGVASLLSTEAGFSTDEIHLKSRARRGFAVGRVSAFGVLEKTAGA